MSTTELEALAERAFRSASAVQHLLGGVERAATGTYEGQDPTGAVTCRVSGAGRTDLIRFTDGWRSRIRDGAGLATAVMDAYRSAMGGYWESAFGPMRGIGSLDEVDVPPEERSRLRAESLANVEAMMPSFGDGPESLEQINARVREVNSRLSAQLEESRCTVDPADPVLDSGDPTMPALTATAVEPVVAQRCGELVVGLAIHDGWARRCPSDMAAEMVARAMRGESVRDEDTASSDELDPYDPTNPFQGRSF